MRTSQEYLGSQAFSSRHEALVTPCENIGQSFEVLRSSSNVELYMSKPNVNKQIVLFFLICIGFGRC